MNANVDLLQRNKGNLVYFYGGITRPRSCLAIDLCDAIVMRFNLALASREYFDAWPLVWKLFIPGFGFCSPSNRTRNNTIPCSIIEAMNELRARLLLSKSRNIDDLRLPVKAISPVTPDQLFRVMYEEGPIAEHTLETLKRESGIRIDATSSTKGGSVHDLLEDVCARLEVFFYEANDNGVAVFTDYWNSEDSDGLSVLHLPFRLIST